MVWNSHWHGLMARLDDLIGHSILNDSLILYLQFTAWNTAGFCIRFAFFPMFFCFLGHRYPYYSFQKLQRSFKGGHCLMSEHASHITIFHHCQCAGHKQNCAALTADQTGDVLAWIPCCSVCKQMDPCSSPSLSAKKRPIYRFHSSSVR